MPCLVGWTAMGRPKQPATVANGRWKAGRTTRLTAKVQEEFCKAISTGVSLQSAAAHAGVNLSRVQYWLAKGAEHQRGGFHSFRVAYEKAWSEFEIRNAVHINNAAASDWKAGLTILERRMPKEWGRTDRTQLTGADGSPLTVHATIDHRVICDDEAIRLENELLARISRPKDSGGPGAAPPG